MISLGANNSKLRIVYLILLLIVFFQEPEKQSVIDPVLISNNLFIYLIAVILHFYFCENKNWFRFDVLFLVGFSIVHIQWPLMYITSEQLPKNYLRIFINPNLINYTSWLSVIGGISFLLGLGPLRQTRETNLAYQVNYRRLLYFTVFSFIIFVLFAGQQFLSGSVYRGEGGSTAGAGISKYFALFFQVGLTVMTAVMIFNSRRSYNGNLFRWFFSLNRLYLITLFVYILLFLSIGDRGGPLSILITILILVGTYIRRFRWFELIAIAIPGILITMIIGLGRNESSGNGILSAGGQKVQLNSGFDYTLELANSFRTLSKAVDYNTDSKRYHYGLLWTSNLLAPLPFGQNVFLQLSGTEDYELGSAKFITYKTFGKNAKSGEGTSLIADIFLNFGSYGVIIFMFVLGVVMRYVLQRFNSPDQLVWVVVGAVFAGYSLYFGRASYFVYLRDLVWGIILLRLLVRVKRIA